VISPDQLNQVSKLISNASSVLVIFNEGAGLDAAAAALALGQSLENSGKSVVVASPEADTDAELALAGMNKVSRTLGNRNLVLSFDYDETAVEKVSYHIGEETNKFFLTIKPQQGYPPLSADSIDVSYAGSDADLVFLVGIAQYGELDQLYYGNEQLFENTTTITFHHHEPEIGQVHLNTAGSAAMSTVMAQLIQQLQLNLSADAATNLLAGMELATNRFQSMATSAETFEMAAWLMNRGARRMRLSRAVEVKPDVVKMPESPQELFGDDQKISEAVPASSNPDQEKKSLSELKEKLAAKNSPRASLQDNQPRSKSRK